jgi:hypothetical protein
MRFRLASQILSLQPAQSLLPFVKRCLRGDSFEVGRTSEELPGLVALNVSKTMKSYPATGWVKADSVASADALKELAAQRVEAHFSSIALGHRATHGLPRP